MEKIQHIKVSVWYDVPVDFVGYITIINKYHPHNNMTTHSSQTKGSLNPYTTQQFNLLRSMFLLKNIIIETTDLTRKDTNG